MVDTTSDLCHELDELLDAFCSEAQQQFCIDQHVATQQHLQRTRDTIREAQTLMSTIGLVNNQHSATLRDSLMWTCGQLQSSYQACCDQRQLRSMDETATQQAIAQWQQIRHQFDTKNKELANMARLLRGVADLQVGWQNARSVEPILSSILSTYEFSPGIHVVTVDRQNYGQLGLKRKAVGTQQIVFEYSQLTREEQMQHVAGLCNQFSALFAQTARHNLAQIEAQIRLTQPSTVTSQWKQLHDQLCLKDDTDNENVESDRGSFDIIDDIPPTRPTPFRISASDTESSLLWCPSNTLQNMPMPSFTPTPWQWNDLLKTRRPYRPLLLGLLKKRGRQNWFRSMLKDLLSFGSKNAEEKNAPFATVSVTQLCQYFALVGRQFYKDVLNSVKLIYNQNTYVLQEVNQGLMQSYRNLQLQSSKAVMQRALIILEELTRIENEQRPNDQSSEKSSTPQPAQ
ncbi:hypothetical protein DFQ28_007033 [Apophysomyces sp. BC1034]|nr:hypothetical protein DFQ30_006658 [Apophysomyces sp. BC1015]KAG0176651.1 hypothetical protein DFQ29_005861 [Apophysomyces sp. BC1021]KAG0186996.1 hypothetical protein DFQ28_007033 [Apophysomyces sp. BC1034]